METSAAGSAATAGPVSPTNLLSAHAIGDPYATYRALRERGPITWLPEHRAHFFATYEAVHAGFRDSRLSSDRMTPLEARLPPEQRAALADTFELLRGWMVFHDPPHHERLRGPVRRAFTPKAVEALRPFVERTVDELVDAVLARVRDGETVDLVADFAFPLPAVVIAELLGVPHADRDEFRTWSNELAAIVFGGLAGADRIRHAASGTAHFIAYFTDLIRRFEQHPEDNLVSALIAARDDADPPLSPTELVGACTLLLFAGHETTTSLIANAARVLLEHPDERRWMHEHPEATNGAAEELHRFDGSSKVMVRVVADDHARDGVELRSGQTVFLGIGSANRDPAAFADPERLRLDRPDAHRHLGFGYGMHFCLGAPLARLESQVALGGFAGRLHEVDLAVDAADLVFGATILGRGLASLPVALAT